MAANRILGARHSARNAFTLLELLVCIAIVSILAALSLVGIGQMKSISQGAFCANNLQQLGTATNLYLDDHQHKFFPYYQNAPGGRLWYYGYETSASMNSPEGSRSVDMTQSPLYPYIQQLSGIGECPAFPFGSAMAKPKYQGASWGYGYNKALGVGPRNMLTISNPSKVLLFGDCAQINNFQAPASASHPMLEEFYYFDNSTLSYHFRHGNSANILFLDGHVERFTMYPGTLDTKLPAANVGRITPVGSSLYLQ